MYFATFSIITNALSYFAIILPHSKLALLLLVANQALVNFVSYLRWMCTVYAATNWTSATRPNPEVVAPRTLVLRPELDRWTCRRFSRHHKHQPRYRLLGARRSRMRKSSCFCFYCNGWRSEDDVPRCSPIPGPVNVSDMYKIRTYISLSLCLYWIYNTASIIIDLCVYVCVCVCLCVCVCVFVFVYMFVCVYKINFHYRILIFYRLQFKFISKSYNPMGLFVCRPWHLAGPF